jgi:hypothetical protein
MSNPYQNNPYQSPGYAPSSKAYSSGGQIPPSGMAIASLVLGILADVSGIFGFCCCLSTPLSLVFGAIGLVLGFFGLREVQSGAKTGHGLALGGMITSGIGLLLAIIWLLMFAFAIVAQPNGNVNFNNL